MGKGERNYDSYHFQILEFWVDKDLQRKGIGSKLLADFTEYIKANRFTNFYLITSHGMQTEGFYKKNGFKTSDYLCIMSKKI